VIQLFKSGNPLKYPVLLCYVVVLKLPLLIHQIPSEIFHLNYVANYSASVILLFVEALAMNTIVTNLRIADHNNSSTALFVILSGCALESFLPLSSVLLNNLLIVMLILILYKTYNTNINYRLAFDAGLIVSIASFIYLPSSVLLIFIFIALSFLRPFNWREWFIAVIGFAVPFLLILCWAFLTDRFENVVSQHFQFIETNYPPQMDKNESRLALSIPVAVWGLLLLNSLYIIQRDYLKRIVQIRKFLVLNIWLLFILIISVGAVWLIPGYELFRVQHFLIIILPLSVLIAYSFDTIRRKLMAEVIHLFLLLLILFFQYQNQLLG